MFLGPLNLQTYFYSALTDTLSGTLSYCFINSTIFIMSSCWLLKQSYPSLVPTHDTFICLGNTFDNHLSLCTNQKNPTQMGRILLISITAELYVSSPLMPSRNHSGLRSQWQHCYGTRAQGTRIQQTCEAAGNLLVDNIPGMLC